MRQLENWNHPYFNRKAQALLELTIFGSILIMLLGILINYGLRYNFQQQVMQQVFRKALKSAADSVNDGTPTSVTHVLLKDKHIPNPSNPFAIGSFIPVSASATVVRNYKTQETADTVEELPHINIEAQGQVFSYSTAGFREEYNVPEDSLDKYKEIYGGNNVWETGDGECLETEINPETGEEVCNSSSKNIKIIDSVAGEIIDYDSTVKQCRQIVDEEVFIKECERGKSPDSDTDCADLASKQMNAPWYCANYETTLNPSGSLYTYNYTFPVLNQIFGFAIAYNKPKSMGLQADYIQTQTLNENRLRKEESTKKIDSSDGAGIKNTEALDWQVETKRNIIYKTYSDESGNIAPAQEVTSNASQKKTKTWTTPW